MRFDDSLQTVLAADSASRPGARAAFLQLTDLLARRRVPAKPELLARLATLGREVRPDDRLSAARALAHTSPPPALVALFGADRPDVARAALSVVYLADDEWADVVARVGPVGRSVLRARTDLSPAARLSIAQFGTTDFSLTHTPAAPDEVTAEPIERFEIAELVARLATSRRNTNAAPLPASAPPDTFQFEADVNGRVRWIDETPREAAIGLTVSDTGGAMTVPGTSPLAGAWQLSTTRTYNRMDGRLRGWSGRARRRRAEAPPGGAADGLRRLMHELRTPTTAIAGFSELIESELLGPVAAPYRHHAATIHRDVTDLVAAIDDIDLAARLDGDAVSARTDRVHVGGLLDRVVRARSDDRMVVRVSDAAVIAADAMLIERLFTRLTTVLLDTAEADETLTMDVVAGVGVVEIRFALPTQGERTGQEERSMASPLLGSAFVLRTLVRLAQRLGGTLVIDRAAAVATFPADDEAAISAPPA